MRLRNSSVLARSCSSVSFFISGSSALMRSTSGARRFISRAWLVPKTLVINLLINATFPQETACPGPRLAPTDVRDGNISSLFLGPLRAPSTHTHPTLEANTLDASHKRGSHLPHLPAGLLTVAT